MLAYLFRSTKKIEYAVAIARGPTFRVYEGPRCDETKRDVHASAEEARAAFDHFVARRLKSGWRILHRVEDPTWIDWVDELERMFQHVIDDAAAARVPHDPKATYFRRAYPRAESGALPGFAQVTAAVQFQWSLGDPKALQSVDRFVVSGAQSPLWRREDGRLRRIEEGVCVDGTLENRFDEGARVETMELAAFAAWFPRYVRDDVMGFQIAGLSRSS